MRSVALALATASLQVLQRLEPELAHHLAMTGLRLLRPLWPAPVIPADLGINILGLRFAHPVGVAAGFDKDGDYLDAIGRIGFSHIEVGTVTPEPQEGNPRPRLFRIPGDRALVNRMGFNSKGVEHVVEQLRRSKFTGVRGVSIGKNAVTPIELAEQDYLRCFRQVYRFADYAAVNVSSPNTANLRELQSKEGLQRIIIPLQEEGERLRQVHGKRTPILVKVAPDLTDDQVLSLAVELRRTGVDGVIATNTTMNWDGGRGALSLAHGGGLSGEPLHLQSVAVIRQLRSELGVNFPIIGVGSITTAAAALATLDAGANLIQVYTGLIYQGPTLLTDILDALVNRQIKKERVANVA